jgi:flagellar biosynthesis/type III secretory pathway M-ring protein FliF/YscJ
MRSWQNGIAQLCDWVRQHPQASRWGGLAILAVLLLAVAGNQALFGEPPVALFDSRQLTTDEIGLMQVAFGKSGLNEYEIQGSQIVVPRQQRADYLKSLDEHGAVPYDLRGHDEGSASFDFFQTRSQQRLQQIARKKRTIRDMVLQLRFVERAIVDYDETRGATPFEDMQRTAVVNVSPAGNRMLTMSEVKAIRDTVGGAVAGLHAEQITIIDTFASKSYTGAVASESEQLQPHTVTKMQAERKYETKIRSALTAYPGIRVNVEVGIDPVVRRVRDERNVASQPVVVEQTIQRETSVRAPSASPSFINSVFTLGANRGARVSPFPEPQERHSTERTQSLANGTFQTTETAGPVITHVNVSIGLPERCVRYFVDRQAGQQPLDAAAEERLTQQVFNQLQEDIRQKVGPLVPPGAEEHGGQHIVVTVDREIPLSTGPENATAPPTASLRHWLWLVLVAAGLGVAACLLPGRNRRGRTSEPEEDREPARPAWPAMNDADPAAAEQLPGTAVIGEFSGTAASETGWFEAAPGSQPSTAGSDNQVAGLDSETQSRMRRQLDQWCRENPEAAAATIRQWLDRKAG